MRDFHQLQISANKLIVSNFAYKNVNVLDCMWQWQSCQVLTTSVAKFANLYWHYCIILRHSSRKVSVYHLNCVSVLDPWINRMSIGWLYWNLVYERLVFNLLQDGYGALPRVLTEVTACIIAAY